MGVSKFKLLAAGAVLAASLLAGTYGFWPVKAQAPGTPGAAAPAGYPGAPAPALRPAPGSDPFPYPGMPQQNPPAFEYKVVELRGRADATQKELNRYGNEGWELVSVTANIQNGPELKTAYLKRKKTSVPIGPGMPGVGLFPPGGGPPSVPGIPGGGPMPPALPAGSGPGIGGPMPPAAGGGGLLAPSSGAPSVGGGIPAATPGVGGVPNDPTKGTNLVRSRATVDEVSRSWIATEQGANYAINAATRYFKKDRQGKLAPAGQSDLKPGGSIEIYFDKNARVVARIIVE